MDVSSRIKKPKNRKLDGDHGMDGSSNNLGNLPDSILRHILSVLPTKDAVGTSILSKRWQYLWTSIPNLEFQQGLPAKRKLFMTFVERVLLLHDSSNVKNFSLTCDVLNDASHIGSWISTVVRRKVQKIDISLSNFEEPFVLPHCLFTCDSLTMLRIEMCCILELPSSICFSSLKTLILEEVTFLDDYSTQKLFSGCPVLEHLCIQGCNWENLKVVSISAPKLLVLIIDEYDSGSEIIGQSGSSGCQVMIFGISLKFISYSGEFINDYCLYNASSLLIAHICIIDDDILGGDERRREVAYRANKLLRELSNVNELIISGEFFEVQDYAKELFPHLPMFNNLTNVIVDLMWLSFDSGAFLRLLQKFPCLKSIEFEEVFFDPAHRKDDLVLDPVPLCFSSHLESIEIKNFYGGEEELFAIKFLLENATVLKRMVIKRTMDYGWDLKKQKKVHEQLSMLFRGSACCSIVLYESLENAKTLMCKTPTQTQRPKTGWKGSTALREWARIPHVGFPAMFHSLCCHREGYISSWE